MITCKQVYETASDYMDTSSSLTTRIWLRLHLMMCKHCRRYVHQLRITSSATAHLDKPKIPEDEEIDRLVNKLTR
ncbi:MAG: zf-HC2 domain-containing protein [Pseudomonadales bacterium]